MCYVYRNTVGFWLHMLNLLLYALYLGCLTTSIIVIGPVPINSSRHIIEEADNSSIAVIPTHEENLYTYNQQVSTTWYFTFTINLILNC